MSGYIGTQPVPQATQTRDSFTATSGQTSFATGGYTPNFLDVYLNGVKLASADYTATNGSDVVLASGAATGDILEVVAYTAFDTANVTGATNFTVTGAFTSQGIDDNGNATALTIDSNENVLVGATTSNSANVGHGFNSDGFVYHTRDGGAMLRLNRLTSDGDIMQVQKNGSTVGTIGVSSDGASFGNATQHVAMHSGKLFPASPTHSALDNTIDLGYSGGRFKNLYLTGGVYLGGTGSANKLDDYEQGTWTGSISFGGGTTGQSYAGNTGYYTKVGQAVTITVYVNFSNQGSSTGNAKIEGLPFTCTGGSAYNPGGLHLNQVSFTGFPQAYVLVGQTTISLGQTSESGTFSNLTHSNFTNGTGLIFATTYMTDA